MEAKQIQKYKDKTVPKLLQLAQKVFNAYIRKRDNLGNYFVCISCQKPKALGQMHAGHFFSAGHNPSVRFDEDNVHGQCIHCNTYQHGNLAKYKDNLIRKIGKERFEALEVKVGFEKRVGKKWDRFELIEVIEKYKNG